MMLLGVFDWLSEIIEFIYPYFEHCFLSKWIPGMDKGNGFGNSIETPGYISK